MTREEQTKCIQYSCDDDNVIFAECLSACFISGVVHSRRHHVTSTHPFPYDIPFQYEYRHLTLPSVETEADPISCLEYFFRCRPRETSEDCVCVCEERERERHIVVPRDRWRERRARQRGCAGGRAPSHSL
jgi:hypothetical protein